MVKKKLSLVVVQLLLVSLWKKKHYLDKGQIQFCLSFESGWVELAAEAKHYEDKLIF